MLLNYLKYHHTPNRMVVAGVGVNHDDFVKLVEKHFVDSKPTWELETIPSRGATNVDLSHAQYTGGSKIVSKTFYSFQNLITKQIQTCRKNVKFQFMLPLDYQNWLML